MSATITVFRATGVLGAYVEGVDLSVDVTEETIAEIRRALLDHHVLFFRDQQLTPEQQIAFGHRFGELDTHPFVDGRADHPEVIEIVTDPDDGSNFGGGWHTDVTFLPEPDLGSILYAVELPDVGSDEERIAEAVRQALVLAPAVAEAETHDRAERGIDVAFADEPSARLAQLAIKEALEGGGSADDVAVWLWRPSSTGEPLTAAGEATDRELRINPKISGR